MKAITIIIGILFLLAGIFLFATPGLTFLSIAWILSILLLVAGISIIIDYIVLRKTNLVSGFDLAFGIVMTLFGILLLVNQPLRFIADTFAIYLLGAWMLIGGIIRIVQAIRARKLPGSGWGWLLTFGIIMVLLGIYSFIHPLVPALALGWLVAFYIVITGIDMIAFGVSLRKSTAADGSTIWETRGEYYRP